MYLELYLNNPYYPWKQAESGGFRCYYKGTFFRGTDVLSDSEVVREVIGQGSGVPEVDRLREVAARTIGEFCIVIETDARLFCISDRIRSVPLFYATVQDRIIVSDDANIIRSALHPALDPESAAEFLVTGYVTGEGTLFQGLRQTNAGEILVLDKRTGSVHTTPYYRYLHGDYYQEDGTALMNVLDEILYRAFERLMASTAGRGQQIVVPLSGGLDSRIIAAMLRIVGAKDVVCYNYGHPINRESRASQKVAEALEYPWHFIEYTQDAWEECYTSPEMRTYQKYSGNLASQPHIQDFFAVRTLKAEGIVQDNAVFVPGHAGDMLSGSHIPASYQKDGNYSQEKVIDDLLTKHYSLLGWNHNGLRSLYSQKIARGCGDIRVHDNDSCANALEYFDFYERQAKFIVNAVRVYEFFGYSWSLPFWDAELIDFYLHVPLHHRIGQKLYKRYARERLFVGKYEALRKIECTSRFETPLNNFLSDARHGPSFLMHLICTGGQKTSWYNKILAMLEENRLPLPDALMKYPSLVSLVGQESAVPEIRLNGLIIQSYLSLIIPDDGIQGSCPVAGEVRIEQ
jgi:asparagine synthase (glutamine-hydrolysing)